MMLIKESSLLVLFVFSAAPFVAGQDDFETSLTHFGELAAAVVGNNVKFVVTAGNNYPPIADDVSFWCITP